MGNLRQLAKTWIILALGSLLIPVFFLASAAYAYAPQAAVDYAGYFCNKVSSDGWYMVGEFASGVQISTENLEYTCGTSVGVVQTDLNNRPGVWKGVDCAHFVSCCIGAPPICAGYSGGGLNVPSRPDFPGVYGKISASALVNWLLGPGGDGVEVSTINDLGKGDVIGYDTTGDGAIHHVALYLGNSLVAAHSGCTCGSTWTLGYPSGRFTFIHIGEATLPTVETIDATSVSETTAFLNGRVLDNGGSNITARGFYWGIATENWTSSVGVSGDYFAHYLTNLEPGTTYRFRAYAQNSAGWGSGSTKTFTTLSSCSAGTPGGPNPSNGATNVSVNQDLSWTCSGGSGWDSFDIYFGTSSSPPRVSSNHTSTSYPLGTLNYNTLYYWKIVANKSGCSSVTGPVWHFTTESQPCTYSITPSSNHFGYSGGTDSVSVTTQSGCSWTATSNKSWIHITSGGSGTGSGTVYYSVDTNSSTNSRTGTMTIAGKTFTVNQDGAAWITITVPNGGEIGKIGDTEAVMWDEHNAGSNVELEYSTDEGTNWKNIINSTANDGEYSWTIPNDPSTQCRVKVISISYPSVFDISDDDFTICLDTAAVFRVESTGDVLADGSFYGRNFLAGSADVAEWIPVSEPVDPGDVLELDPENPGQYRKARGPYSDLVAGVVSTQPGFILGSSPATEDSGLSTPDRALLALVGIVPVKVTDEGGPIHAGDLLVTSSTPGYAMRWDPRSGEPCDLIGKALEPMTDVQGVISVLLSAH